jgi:hypothetical protein
MKAEFHYITLKKKKTNVRERVGLDMRFGRKNVHA